MSALPNEAAFAAALRWAARHYAMLRPAFRVNITAVYSETMEPIGLVQVMGRAGKIGPIIVALEARFVEHDREAGLVTWRVDAGQVRVDLIESVVAP